MHKVIHCEKSVIIDQDFKPICLFGNSDMPSEAVQCEKSAALGIILTVDPSRSSLQPIRHSDCTLIVFGVNSSGEAVSCVVGHIQDLLLGLELRDRDDWTENLLANNLKGHVSGTKVSVESFRAMIGFVLGSLRLHKLMSGG